MRLTLLPAFPLIVAALGVAACDESHESEGATLARTYCGACHAFPEPRLLDKKTWVDGVLPQMAPRLGVPANTLFNARYRNPRMVVLPNSVSAEDWQKIVAYYRQLAPDTLPSQTIPLAIAVDPPSFRTVPFVPGLKSSAIITLLKTDSVHERIFIGEAGSNTLRVFDWSRKLLSTLQLGSPPTDLLVEGDTVMVLESGILDPNDEAKGSLVQYDFTGADSLRSPRVVLDSLLRPVFVEHFDFDKDGHGDFLICEYGNNRGRLALYDFAGSSYRRQVVDPGPGAIRFEIRDLTGDGSPDIVALLAQGDERIVAFINDGKGNFPGEQRILARFPPVYGSMYFAMHDFNGDGYMDIVYVNGDNFDYSHVLKPYHGVRILENDGKNIFHERYFFPIYGAARAEIDDFDHDGDLDILTTSNFADFEKHPERGIMFFENAGQFQFRPSAFTAAAANQWNLIATGDLNNDGSLDVIVGAMDLGNISTLQRNHPGESLAPRDAILFFENTMKK